MTKLSHCGEWLRAFACVARVVEVTTESLSILPRTLFVYAFRRVETM